MAMVAESHLDPAGEYFSAFGYVYDTRSDTPTVWTDEGGALAFQLFRPNDGATEVYVQIATSRRFAVACGVATKQECFTQRYMDGNRFTQTNSTTVDRGIEVQWRPEGTEVITAIARNTGPGKKLALQPSDLRQLIQDPRLRLPER
jgi:hypothetical protein